MRIFYNVPLRVFIALASGAVSWYAYLLIGKALNIPNAEFSAGVLIISVLIHEMGHWLAYRRHGVPSLIFFLVILGGTLPLDIEKAKRLPDTKEAEVVIAGPYGNVVVMIASVFCWRWGLLSKGQMDVVLNLNAALILFNLIPIAGLDGSRFVKLLFRSASPQWDRTIFELTAIPVTLAMMIILYLRGDVTIAVPLMLYTLYRKSRTEDEEEVVGKPMTPFQLTRWSIIFALLACTALVVFTFTPTWST